MKYTTGRAFTKTDFSSQGARRAGYGILHDKYGDNDGNPNYDPGLERVKLPSDCLSKEQWEARNGPVIIIHEGSNNK